MAITFQTDCARLQATFDRALAGLAANVVAVRPELPPVLIEGAEYRGIWLECGPMEGAIYAAIDPGVAIRNHRVFFANQREDGYLPCYVWPDQLGTGQIQMVVPIAATAWETYEWTGDRGFLTEAYDACRRWDAWLVRYRDRRGLGLCEAFCEYDTGHDNSPRCRDMPHQCPGNDARSCPTGGKLPYLAPDLSATVYGGRLALARMASELGRPEAATEWSALAGRTKRNLLAHCFDPEDLAFYDRDAQGNFVRIRGDAMLRVLGEHVVDGGLFEKIYRRHVRNPAAFWTAWPFPSIAADDPAFVGSFPVNSWGGAAQALTALRAPRWMDYYGKTSDLVALMTRWVEAILRSDAFVQQINPFTGDAIRSADGYSPAMLVLVDHVARLHGIIRQGEELWWNCMLPEKATQCTFTLETAHFRAVLDQQRGRAVLHLSGRPVGRVGGPCRIVTDLSGRLKNVVATVDPPAAVSLAGFAQPQ